MTSAAMTSSSVAGAAVPMSDSTGWWVWMEVPQFPVTMPAKYLPIRTGSGWSRPRYCRARASCAAEACGPAHADGRIAGHHAGDHERQDHDARDDHDRQGDPADGVPGHPRIPRRIGQGFRSYTKTTFG